MNVLPAIGSKVIEVTKMLEHMKIGEPVKQIELQPTWVHQVAPTTRIPRKQTAKVTIG